MELSLNSLYNLESQLIPETCLDECRLLPMLPPCPTLGGLSGLRAPDLGGSNVPTEKENHSSQSRLLSTTFSMLALPWQTDRFSRNGRGNGNGNAAHRPGRPREINFMSRYICFSQNGPFDVCFEELFSKVQNPGGFFRKIVF